MRFYFLVVSAVIVSFAAAGFFDDVVGTVRIFWIAMFKRIQIFKRVNFEMKKATWKNSNVEI